MQKKLDMAYSNFKPYKICCAYDTETTNVSSFENIFAFPILYQIGTFFGDIKQLNNDNVEQLVTVNLFRDYERIYSFFDSLIEKGIDENFVPVIMVHNLGFDMYSLAPYFKNKECEVLAKTSTSPITIKIKNEKETLLVFWDTSGFYMKSLEKLGEECGYKKLVGSWNYDLIRTPETPLTQKEIEYAKHDIYVLFAYLPYYLKNNHLLNVEDFACKIVTKTSAVRAKRLALFQNLKPEGKNTRFKVGNYWHYLNNQEKPKSNDELYTMHACTRGGFTFCASKNASKVFDMASTDYSIIGFDATSQHPAQMVSHVYPVQFKKQTKEILELDLQIVQQKTIDDILNNWREPFGIAFNACIEFYDLKPKENSIADYGIYPLASARIKDDAFVFDNEAYKLFKDDIALFGFKDTAKNAKYEFGKLVSCDYCKLFLTELAFYEMCNFYTWSKCDVLFGYDTARFAKPTDLSILSVMYFYKAKNTFKGIMNKYLKREEVADDDLKQLETVAPFSLIESIKNKTVDDAELKAYYQIIKSDLNSLFGIEATNEARADTVLNEDGIVFDGFATIENLPKNSKVWYQYGQRIVGWSRVAQLVNMELLKPHVTTIINGDTDSIKILVHEDDIESATNALEKYNKAIDKAKHLVTSRVRKQYPKHFDELSEIGYYVSEFKVKKFCAAWNKAYAMQYFDKKENKEVFDITLAGLATSTNFKDVKENIFRNSLVEFCNYMYELGATFDEICSLVLGYNVTISSNITKLNGRKIPKFGEFVETEITDYLGNCAHVKAPAAVALYPMQKEINNTLNEDNYKNMQIAYSNNDKINTRPIMLDFPVNGKPQIIELSV